MPGKPPRTPARSGLPLPVTPDNPFGLTDGERVFVAQYIVDFDAQRSALHAGYTKTKCWMLLNRPEIRGAIQAALHQRQKQVQKLLGTMTLDAERVLVEIARIALVDPRRMFDADGALRPIDEIDDHTAAAIAGIKTREIFEQIKTVDEHGNEREERKLVGYTREIKLLDKNAALDKAMRHLGGYEADNRQKNPLEEADTGRLAAARAALAALLKKHENTVDNQKT